MTRRSVTARKSIEAHTRGAHVSRYCVSTQDHAGGVREPVLAAMIGRLPGGRGKRPAQLNRGEAYHRFRRAVAFVNGGKFRVKTEAEQQIWNECSRLITNAIIYYNMALLSKVYEQKCAAGDQQAIDLLRAISPVARQHVNLFGAIEFSPRVSTVDLDALATRYSDPVYRSKVLQEEFDEPLG